MKIATNTTCPAFALFALACFALSPAAQAVAPAPGGGYPGQNTAEGDDALFSLTTGVSNTAIGFDALFSNAGGFGNTGVGSSALRGNTGGIDNTAVGAAALINNTNGFGNVAVGFSALLMSTTTVGNTAVGFGALGFNTIGDANVAIGFDVLGSNTTGYGNTATGYDALITNSTGSNNTATGFDALSANATGNNNTANGFDALVNNTTGSNNTSNGDAALFSNTTGSNNTATGDGALLNNGTGSFNIALGAGAGSNHTTGSNNIYIGSGGAFSESRTIRIGGPSTHGRTFVAGISGVTVAAGVGVIVDTNGQLGTVVSSERFKDGIKPMDKASEAILALKPVTFRYKHELDPKGIPQFGLVAEDVEKVNPALVARDAEGKAYTVRYDAVNIMLLNEFIKEHRKVEELEAKLANKEKDFTARLKEQDAKIQQVNDKLELSKPAPHTVLNDQ
jgi:trimeric autotransporter adhesin